MKHSYYAQETYYLKALHQLFPEKGGGGTASVNVRSVSKKHNAVRQADSGFGVRCSRKSSEAPLRLDSPLPVGPLKLMTLAIGRTPRAGSQQSILIKVKEESEEVGLKFNIQKTNIMVSGPITSWQIDKETVETVADFILGGSKITADGDCSQEIKRHFLLEEKL